MRPVRGNATIKLEIISHESSDGQKYLPIIRILDYVSICYVYHYHYHLTLRKDNSIGPVTTSFLLGFPKII